MNLYLVSRTDRVNYDEFDSFVVAAESEDEALRAHPSGGVHPGGPDIYGTWPVASGDCECRLIGTAAEGVSGVVLASFNAG